MKLAVTVFAELMVTVHVEPLVLLQPDQLTNREPLEALAVSVTDVPLLNTSEQSEPQEIPVPVTVPEPLPDLLTVSVYRAVNVTVTERAVDIDTVQVEPLELVHPLHDVKTEPLAGAAVSVTEVPWS